MHRRVHRLAWLLFVIAGCSDDAKRGTTGVTSSGGASGAGAGGSVGAAGSTAGGAAGNAGAAAGSNEGGAAGNAGAAAGSSDGGAAGGAGSGGAAGASSPCGPLPPACGPCPPDGQTFPPKCTAQGWECPALDCACGGPDGIVCPKGGVYAFYCDFPDNKCGTNGAFGTCNSLATALCQKSPYCGCDGNLYPSACAASFQGADLSLLGNCAQPSGTFVCGAAFCMLGTQFCNVMESGIPGVASQTFCDSFAAGCAAADCSCLPAWGCTKTCVGTVDTGIVVTTPCPG